MYAILCMCYRLQLFSRPTVTNLAKSKFKKIYNNILYSRCFVAVMSSLSNNHYQILSLGNFTRKNIHSSFLVVNLTVFIIWWLRCYLRRYSTNKKGNLVNKILFLAVCKQVVSLQLSIICTAASRIPLFIFFPRRPSWFKTSIVTPKTVHRRLTAHTVSPTVGEIFLKNGVKEPTPNWENNVDFWAADIKLLQTGQVMELFLHTYQELVKCMQLECNKSVLKRVNQLDFSVQNLLMCC